MRTGSLKTLGIGGLSEPDQLVQVLKELPHCTRISVLRLWLFQSDEDEEFLSYEVRPVTFVCNVSTVQTPIHLQGQLFKGLPHCTQCRELGLEFELFDICS